MERRRFLKLLGIGPVAAVAAKFGIEAATKPAPMGKPWKNDSPEAIMQWFVTEQRARIKQPPLYTDDIYARIWDDVDSRYLNG